MSRIGKLPISVPDKVDVKVDKAGHVTVKGPKGELAYDLPQGVSVSEEDGVWVLKRESDRRQFKASHGTARALINNMVVGVSEGYELQLELIGVGYKASNQGNLLNLTLGYSHTIYFQVPEEIKVTTETQKGKPPVITLNGNDKQLIGQIAAKLKSLRPIEPYKGKGVKFVGEYVRRKVGKTAAA